MHIFCVIVSDHRDTTMTRGRQAVIESPGGGGPSPDKMMEVEDD
jgi:hypothetical protein